MTRVRAWWGRTSRGERATAAAYAALSVALWPSPLLGLLHVESAAVVAGVGFGMAGLAAVGAFREGAQPARVLGRHLALLLIPWALLTVTLLGRPNCGYAQGVVLYLLFAPPSAALAVALAWALTGARLRRPRLAFVLVALAVAVVPVAYDLGLHPQFYSYNHVWGGVLGPIYDEELAVRPGLVAFRALTLLWAALLFVAGWALRGGGWRAARSGAVLAVAVGMAYLLAPRLGIVTTAGQIEARLAGWSAIPGAVLHYDPAALAPDDRRRLERELAYRYARLRGRVGGGPDVPVHVYLYPDAPTRAALAGARYVSVAPVWLARPQLHLLQSEATPDVLGHELVHVFARDFGAPVLRASPSVGLVEGLAVALEPPDGLPEPAAQVAAAWRLTEAEAGALAAGPARAVAGAMGPLGFWTGRGAVSYTTTGAFAAWLLQRYGVAPMREAYRTGRFSEAYGQPLEKLARAWAADVRRAGVTPEAAAVAAWRFAQPSLFERRCPHHVPAEVRHTRAADAAVRAGEAGTARRLYERALEANANYGPALVGWARTALATGAAPGAVARRLDAALRRDTSANPAMHTAAADALALAGDSAAARRHYASAVRELPPFAHEARALIELRSALPVRALRVVLEVGDPGARADRLLTLAGDSPAVWPFAAGLLSEAGHYEAAFTAILRMPPAASPDVERQRRTWRAELAWHARRNVAAAREAAAAAAAWRAADLHGPARRMDDLAAKARWFARR